MRRALVFAVVLALPLAGCGRKTYTREELEKATRGLNADELRAKLGAPAEIQQIGEIGGYWHYRRLTIDPATGRTDDKVMIAVVNGRVSEYIYFGPGSEGKK